MLEVGSFVGIYALTSRLELNDTVGIVQGYDKKTNRHIVRTDEGNIRKLKRCNLIIEKEMEDVECSESDLSPSGQSGLEMLTSAEMLGNKSATPSRR